MNAKELKDCMRQYVGSCKNTDAFKNMKQFVHELEDESNLEEANRF